MIIHTFLWLCILSPTHNLFDKCKLINTKLPVKFVYYWVYSREDQEECQTLKSTILTDEIEQNLHSKDDSQACHQYIFNVIPEFKEFLKLHVVPTVGDWPTLYQQKKIVCPAELDQEGSSLILELGQFHVYLNSSEDVVKQYYPIFKEIYASVFGQRVRLPEKPKPDKVALCIVNIILWLAKHS